MHYYILQGVDNPLIKSQRGGCTLVKHLFTTVKLVIVASVKLQLFLSGKSFPVCHYHLLINSQYFLSAVITGFTVFIIDIQIKGGFCKAPFCTKLMHSYYTLLTCNKTELFKLKLNENHTQLWQCSQPEVSH